MNSQELAYEVARIIDDKRGHDILIIDLRGIADIADFFVIGTGDNNRQVDAIVDEVENQLRPKDVRAVAIDGHRPRLPARGSRFLPLGEALGRRPAC